MASCERLTDERLTELTEVWLSELSTGEFVIPKTARVRDLTIEYHSL